MQLLNVHAETKIWRAPLLSQVFELAILTGLTLDVLDVLDVPDVPDVLHVLDVLDVADRRRERTFVVIDHSSRHVRRSQAVVRPDDRDHRNPDIRENIRL